MSQCPENRVHIKLRFEFRGRFVIYKVRRSGLHLLRDVDLEHGEHVEDDVLDADAEGQTGLLDGGVCALDAAVAVEAVEGAGQVDDEAVDAAGVVLLGGHDDLLREGGQHPDKVHLGRLGQQGGVDVLSACEGHALALHLLEDGADAGVCVPVSYTHLTLPTKRIV